jgi:hypothetical protein
VDIFNEKLTGGHGMRNLMKVMVVFLSLSFGAVVLSGCENQQAEPEGETEAESAGEEGVAEEAETNDEAESEPEEETEGEEEGEHAVVESGTYTGTITEVNADESEIYVDADGKELELYFIEDTELTQAGEAAEFSALEKGQKVEVEIKKVGKRLDPMSVKILE